METQLQETTLDLPRIVVFHKFKPECRLMMGLMLERIGKFAEKYCPDTIPELLMECVDVDFVQRKPGFLILGFIDDDDYLCGHVLADIDVPRYGQTRRCCILQYELDEGISIGFLQAGFDSYIVDWAKENYCSDIIAFTKTEQTKRAFTRFYDFQTDLIQVKRAL